MKSCTIPNGEKLYCIDRLSAIDSYNEIFNDRIYDNFGLEVKDGDVIFDVGANVGVFSQYISQQANDLTIYAFEPVPAIYKVQKKNLESIKSTQKVHAFNIGLGAEESNVEINYYPRATTLSAIEPVDFELEQKRTIENWEEMKKITPIAKFIPKFLRKTFTKLAHRYVFKEQKVPIKVRTLSDVINENNIGTIDFLKIDAENYEWQVLQGLNDSGWNLIHQIAMEVHTNAQGRENLLEEITTLLKSKGFVVHQVKDGKFAVTGVYLLYAKR
ncbi:MAG: FkbM family methyltransferase [Promethearchaeota archaeon]|nr:MAG: FkbM family methyltransferase [Candidatus Lokiarchaeota archaeon]